MAERQKPRMARVRVEDSVTGETRMETVRMDSLRTSPSGNSELTDDEKRTARELWKRIGHIARPTLTVEQWVEGFTADANPANELREWEHMANTVDKLWSDGVGKTRKTLVDIVLMLSVRVVDIP